MLTKAVVRALTKVLVGVAVGLLIALLLALISEPIGTAPFQHRLSACCGLIGALVLVMATANPNQSPSSHLIAESGMIPNMPAWFQEDPGDVSVSTTAIFGLTGIVLLAIAAVLF